MKTRNFLLSLLCIASLVFMSVACNGLDLDKDTNDTEVDDGPDGGNEEGEEGEEGDDIVPSLKAIFDAMPAGIYTCPNDDATGVIAKGTDGSGFEIADINDYFTYYPTPAKPKSALPGTIKAFDADKTAYSIVYSQAMLHEDYSATWKGVDWSDEMIYKLEARFNSRDEMFHNIGTLTVIAIAQKSGKMTKIDDAGDFTETYLKLADKYQTFSNKVSPDKMMPQTTVYSPSGWIHDLYPEEMETNNFVIPFTGSGKYVYFKVFRWMPTGPTIPPPYSCFVDFVDSVEVLIHDVSEEDARAYFKVLKEKAHATNVYHDSETNENGILSIVYDADGELDPEEIGHTVIYPSYTATYSKSAEGSTLTLKFVSDNSMTAV